MATRVLFSLLIVKHYFHLFSPRLKIFNRIVQKEGKIVDVIDANMSSNSATFLFDDRQRFDARCDHDLLRSSLPIGLDVPPPADLWKRSPIDFTPKNFHPTRKKLARALSTTDLSSSREKREQTSHSLDTSVMQPFAMPYEHNKGSNQHGPPDYNDDDDFMLDTRVNYDPVQRMLNTDQYRNPQPHDYRQVNFDDALARLLNRPVIN
jgi:hypothetical protein